LVKRRKDLHSPDLPGQSVQQLIPLWFVNPERRKDGVRIPPRVVPKDAIRGAVEVRDALAVRRMRVVEKTATASDELVGEGAIETVRIILESESRRRKDKHRAVPLVAPPAEQILIATR
jgi:hypothetical protein